MPLHDDVTHLILEVFRLNGSLLAAGDALVADLGLTSARWQILGAIALSPTALPVAHIARIMGLTRQAVQRLANELETTGLVRFAPNPHHQRAKLVVLTDRGRTLYEKASARQVPWAARLFEGLPSDSLKAATTLLRTLRDRLDRQEGDPEHR